MSLEFQIRPYTKDDKPQIFILACQLDREVSEIFSKNSSVNKVLREYSRRYFVEAADFSRFVAYKGNDLIGYVIATPNPCMDGEERRPIEDLVAPQEIHSMMADMLVVSQYHRNQGVGKALMRCVLDKAGSKGADSVCGYVAKWNEASMHMLNSLGFERRIVFPNSHLYVKDLG